MSTHIIFSIYNRSAEEIRRMLILVNITFLFAAFSWYGIVIPFTLDPVTTHSFALLTKYEMFETGTRHSAIFSIYNLRIVGKTQRTSCELVDIHSSFPLTVLRVAEILKVTGPLKHRVPGRFVRESFHS